MDRLLPDPAKLLSAWMEWERGDTPPGRTMANLKTAGLRDLLEELVARVDAVPAAGLEAGEAGAEASGAREAGAREAGAAGADAAAGSWTPVV